MTSYVTARDILIPAGTKVGINPRGMQSTLFCDFACVLTAETNGHTSEWVMPFDEALELGIIVPAMKEAVA